MKMGGENDAGMIAGNHGRHHGESNDSSRSQPTHQASPIVSSSNIAAAVVTPSIQQDIEPSSPPSAKFIHHTDARTRALGVKAELEALRSKHLAKSIRNEIVDNGESVPLSASEVQDFFLRKNQMDKAWRQEQRDSIAYLHTYKNHSTTVAGSPDRSSSKRAEFTSQQVYSEMDAFYLQQRALEKEWKRQQKDSMALLHNYRNNTVNGGGSSGSGPEERSGETTVVTPHSSRDTCEFDIDAAIAFHERQQLLEERLLQAVNTPLPPDSPVLSSAVEPGEPLEDAVPTALVGESATKLLEVADHEPSSSSNTEVIYEASTTSIGNDTCDEVEMKVVSPITPVTADGQTEIFEDSVASSEVNSASAAPGRQVEAVSMAQGIVFDSGVASVCVEEHSDDGGALVDDDDDLLDELLADDTGDQQDNLEALLDTNDQNLDTNEVAEGDDMEMNAKTASNVACTELAKDEYDGSHDDMPYKTPEKGERNELQEFDRLVEYMSPGINHDNAPDNLEGLLQVEDEVSVSSTIKRTVTADDNSASDVLGVASDSHIDSVKVTSREPAEPPSPPELNIKSNKGRTVPVPHIPKTALPRRQTARRTESKIVPPRMRISTTHVTREKDGGLPHYMKPTLSTPERRSKVTPSTYSPQQHASPLYSRRETAESFKLKSTKCTNKWVPSLHSSRGGCERCLHFADEDERLKFQRDGHYYRICLVRGGCARSCPCFPRRPDQPPVRLCRKCFYDTHRLGKM